MRTLGVVCLGIFLTFLSLRSLLNSTFFPIHDFTHVTRLVEMDRAVKDGEFPVRWVRDLGYGYGMPLFSFYGPTPYYIAEVFHFIGFSYLWSIKLLLFLMTGAGFAGMYLLCSRWFGRAGGMLAASAFLFIPYRALDLFVRGAFSELFAITIAPWIMHGLVMLRTTHRKQWIVTVSVFFAALFTAHNLMTMMFLPVLYVFGLVITLKDERWKKYLVQFHVALLLGIGLSLFYLLPSFLEKGFTQVDKLIGGYGMYAYHFLYIRQLFKGTWGFGGSILGIEDGMSYSLGLGHLALAGLGGVAWFMRKRGSSTRTVLAFLMVVTAGTLFMTIFKSKPIWDMIPLFIYFQFPWRFISISTVTLPIFAGASVLLFKKRPMRIVFALGMIIVLVVPNLKIFAPESLHKDPKVQYYDDPRKIQASMSDILPDYIPIGMKEIQKPFQKQFELLGQDDKNIEVLADRTQEKLLMVGDAQRTGTLIARIAWFPNWTVYDNGHKTPFIVNKTTDFIEIPIGVGKHLISIKFEDTPLRTTANAVSLVSALCIIGLAFYDRHYRHTA